MEPTYRYFSTPHEFSTWTPQPHRCDLCGRERPGYEGPFHGAGDVNFVCEECMMAGRLKDVNCTTNDPDANALRQQLQAPGTELGDKKIEETIRERTDALVYATPHLVTWQDFFWPAHCGDYCRFLKEVGQPELNELAPDGDGLTFFRTHADNIQDEAHAREVWEDIREDSPTNGENAYPMGVFLFQCLGCGEHVIHWDME